MNGRKQGYAVVARSADLRRKASWFLEARMAKKIGVDSRVGESEMKVQGHSLQLKSELSKISSTGKSQD